MIIQLGNILTITLVIIILVLSLLLLKNVRSKNALKKECIMLSNNNEKTTSESSTKIQIFVRLSQILASSFRRASIFNQIVNELNRYFPNYGLCTVIDNNKKTVFTYPDNSQSYSVDSDIEFDSIMNAVNTNITLSNTQLEEYLSQSKKYSFIYPFPLFMEEKVKGYFFVSMNESIKSDEHLFFTDTATLLSSVLQNVITKNEKDYINEQFGYSVDAKVRDYLLKHGEGGKIQSVSVMFFDIRNFTTLSEKLGPIKSVSLLNDIFSFCDEIIRKQNGFINKFTGDGFMAVFGAPVPADDHQIKAVDAALEILKQIDLPVGIGIASGEAVAGTIGSSKRKEYTVIGDTVNTASRVEGLCKVFGSSLVVSEATILQCSNDINKRYLGLIRLKGKEEPVKVYDLLSKNSCDSVEFEKSLDLFYQGDFEAAKKKFITLTQNFPEDKAVTWYISRCDFHIKNSTIWNGYEQMTEK